MAASGGHWNKGKFKAAGGSAGMSSAEFDRLASGNLKVGDFVWSNEPGMRSVGGTIVGRGKMGKAKGEYWHIRGSRGQDMFIPVGQAVAAGIAGATPG